MKRKNAVVICGVAALPIVGIGLLAIRAAYSQTQQPRNTGLTLVSRLGFTPTVKIEVRDGYRYISSNGIPDHAVGQFPGPGNPNRISPQDYHFRVPSDPKPTDRPSRGQLFGVAVNGVVFDPGTAELWNGDFRWHYEALSGLYGTRGMLGADENFAHVQPNGAYHYHGLPMGLLKKLDYTRKMALVGYAADGFPIYGPYGYTNATDPKSPLKMLKSGYKLKTTERPGGADGPGSVCDGSFASDYEYVAGQGDLDAFNGRTGVTPEYPQGTYYYVLTDGWPFVPRQFRGTPDPSFQIGPGIGRQGGFGRPGGQGNPGGPPPGGGQGFPGGQPPEGQGGLPGGPPPNMIPADILSGYLGLTAEQKVKLDNLTKTLAALRQERFMLPNFAQLKLTNDQIKKIAAGGKMRDVLTAEQKKVLDANQRPEFGGPGGPGGFGGPGGPPPGGEPGGPPPPPEGN